MTYNDAWAWARNNMTDNDPGDWVSTSFAQNWGVAVDQMIDEELSISRWLAESPIRSRNSTIRSWIDEDIVSEDEANAFWDDIKGDYDYSGLALYLRQDRQWDELETDEEIRDRARYDIRESQKESKKVYEKAGFMGTLGMIAGMGTGLMLDPLLWPGLAVSTPLAVARGVTVAARVGRGALAMGAVAGAEEIPIQAFVYDWKQELGMDYSVGDAMTTIAIVTGAGGTIGAFATGLGAWIKKMGRQGAIDDVNKEILDYAQTEAEKMKTHPDAENLQAKDMFEEIENVQRTTQEAGPMQMDTKPLDEILEEEGALDEAWKVVDEQRPDMVIPTEGRAFDVDGQPIPEARNVKEFVAEQGDIAKRGDEALACLGVPRG